VGPIRLGVSHKLIKIELLSYFIIISLTQFIPITPLIIFRLLNKIWDVGFDAEEVVVELDSGYRPNQSLDDFSILDCK
jgi:hypothetical protein